MVHSEVTKPRLVTSTHWQKSTLQIYAQETPCQWAFCLFESEPWNNEKVLRTISPALNGGSKLANHINHSHFHVNWWFTASGASFWTTHGKIIWPTSRRHPKLGFFPFKTKKGKRPQIISLHKRKGGSGVADGDCLASCEPVMICLLRARS